MSDELSLRDLRLQKLARMRELGFDPFAVERFESTGSANELLADFDDNDKQHQAVAFAGRVVSHRPMGGVGFAHLSDGEGKIQGYFRKDDLGEAAWEVYQLLDIGDHVGVQGELFRTKTGEPSIHVRTLVPLSKALHTIPLGKEKEGQQWYGLTDTEQRYRHRNLDLICNPEARRMLVQRTKITQAVRRFFDGRNYLEVETPVLQTVAGGAAARPFTTRYNAYDMDVKLRISLELYLKRLLCGDIPKVYEIGRVFRNEGVSNRHNPEFTLLEFYEAYTDLEGMMKVVEDLFRNVTKRTFGTTQFELKKAGGGGWRMEPIRNSIWVRRVTPEEFGLESNSLPDMLRHIRDKKSRFGRSREAYTLAEWNPDLASLVRQGASFRSKWFKKYICVEVETKALGEPGVYEFKLFRPKQSNREPIRWSRLSHDTCTNELESANPGLVVDFGSPWRRVDLLDEIERLAGVTRADLATLESAHKALGDKVIVNTATGKRIVPEEEHNLGGLIEKLLEVFVEPTLIQPTFVVGYPIETSPLAKKDPNRPGITRRFEGYILGKEICNAFSEINDPIDQRERFEQQLGARAKGDDEAHPMDEEFIYALECGMPPTGGCGIGIDRMAMFLTGAEVLREVIFFPTMKPESREDD